MRMYDLIEKKKHGESLTRQEIRQMVRGFVEGEIPDYQMAAMLMAICFKGIRYYLGSFSNFEDAVKARKQAEEELHNKFLSEFAARQASLAASAADS